MVFIYNKKSKNACYIELTKQQVQSFAPIQKQAEKEIKQASIMKTDAEMQAEIEKRANEITKQKLEQIKEEERQKKN